ncbi:MAG: chromosome segregation protein SMC [Phycisphaerae bacterium]
MFLKRITMTGFKSFADPVDFDFGPGITCIVGPNGCGKSNVVDAFKWVLGEQSAKSLRGQQMQDMIFNGCASRRSSGMAMVNLVFDNADRTLPLDCDEVSVSRKLYRSGESEYLINKEPSRLRAIRELFMDTGVGTDAYCVIEQGRVDALLQSSPVERRQVFEEAAGISKYKARKKEALRKLERTQQNLLRVADIIEEVEKRLRSVKLQAGKARSFQAYDARLRELRSSFSLAEYHRLTRGCRDQQSRAQEASDDATAARTKIDAHEAETAKLTSDNDRLDAELSEQEGRYLQVNSQITAQQERIQAATRRAEQEQHHLANATERLTAQQERARGMEAELGALQTQQSELEQQIEQQNQAIDRLLAADRSLAGDLTHAQALLEDEKAGLIELVRRGADLANQIAKLESHCDSLEGQKGRLAQRDAQIAAELADLLSRKEQLEARRAEVESLIDAEMRRLEEKKAQTQRVQGMQSDLAKAVTAARELRSGLASRQQLLEDLEQNMEGVGAGVRELLSIKASHPDDPASACVAGMVADLFEADLVHALVIEAAVGRQDQFLVVEDSAAFLADAKRFDQLASRMTAICVDRLPPVVNVRDFSDKCGFVARAVDLVRFGERFERLGRHLLGKTLVVESLEQALALARADTDGHRFVTLGGQVVEPNGQISVGPLSIETGLISRKSELRDIEQQLAETEQRIETLSDQLNRANAEAAHLEEVRQELRGAIHDAQTARVEANAAVANIEEAVRRLTQEQPLIAGEVAMLEQQMAQARQRHDESRDSLQQVEDENRRREELVSGHERRIDELVGRRTEVHEHLTDAKVRAGQLNEKRAAAAQSLLTTRRELQTATDAVQAADQEAADSRQRIAEAQDAVTAGRAWLATLEEQAKRLEADSLELRRRRESLRMRREELALATKSVRTELEEAEGQLHEIDMALAELRVRREELIGRVREELDIDLVAQYEQYDHTEQDWQAVEVEIQELRGKIDRLGNVNLDAISEQEELETRHEFLTGQRDDLLDSEKQILALIRQLDAQSIEQFTKAFDQIRENFRDLFRKLFGGGRADIVLADPDDILECGIDIVARPPGKELQNIALMSGGEKTLTAIALLMSIFRSRPAPFALLDEVDAALDEANNDRFNRILLEFVSESQFIIITHSKRTMTVGDQLYGITMQEPGISTRVSVKFETPDEPEASAVA